MQNKPFLGQQQIKVNAAKKNSLVVIAMVVMAVAWTYTK